ncbi:ABC transporter substrate-binding protein [Brevibacillus marinus]|uniref:ABC transporter substrate-binding protein n=1 Tax=Brevibacillus marinus TaxID=2496837 RepID=UPI001F49C03E|nr:ABC transporter substrate-binding protein [Brevibacillus marinus]
MRMCQNIAVLFAILLLVSLPISGCGNAAADREPTTGSAVAQQQTSSSSSAAFPKTITHAKGETVIDAKPRKVAITYFPYADHLFAIGEQDVVAGVVGLSYLRNFPVYDPFTKDGRIADLGDQANLEKMLELAPDVIIAWEQDEEIYDELAKIAKTIVIPQSENWQETITKVAAVIGEEAKAAQYIADYNARLQTLAEKMDDSGIKGKTAIFMMTWGKGFNYYGGVRMEPYYEKLGFRKFAGMKDWSEISLEGVSAINPDYIFLGEDFTGTAELALSELASNPVWNSLQAVKNGNLYIVDTEVFGPLAMGQSKGLDVIEQILNR